MAKQKVAEMPRGMTAVDMTDKPKARRDGSVGQATFEAIEKMTADGSTTKQAAFITYARSISAQPGTVAANYYRVARTNGASSVKPRRSSKRPEAPKTAPRRRGRTLEAQTNSTGNIEQIVAQLVTNVQALSDAVKAESEANAELRQRLDSLRSLLD
jgi:hypothetical protein